MTEPGSQPPNAVADEHDSSCLPVGTRLGEFEITGLIGVGGFGIVYSARDHLLERVVAIKEYMPSALATRAANHQVTVKSERHQETFAIGLRSFVNEARLLAQFDHPSLVKVYRFWEANGTAYMVMPFYKGLTLRAALKRLGEAPQESAVLQMLRPLLDALDVIHAANCYHRDIAPDNILILQSGQPVLLDFGAARRVIGDFTQALTVILKPGFAPVEQYANGPEMRQGPWTDIYALAAVIYYCISGKTPVPAVSRMMRDTLVPASELGRGRYSEAFLAAIDHGLAVRIEDRTASIKQLRDDLGLQEIADPVPLTLLSGAPGSAVRIEVAPDGASREDAAAPPKPVDAPSGNPAQFEVSNAPVAVAEQVAPFEAVVPAAPVIPVVPSEPPVPVPASARPDAHAQSDAQAMRPTARSKRLIPALLISTVVVVAGLWLALGRQSPAPPGQPIDEIRAAALNSRAANPVAQAAKSVAPDFSAQAVLEGLYAQRDPAWQVSVALRSDTLKIDDQNDVLQFRVRSAKAGHLYVWQVGTNATDFWQLFPNPKDRNNRIEADRELVLPRSLGAVYAAGPPGVSRLIAFVTPSPRDFKLTGLHPPGKGEVLDEFDAGTARSLWTREGSAAFAGKPVNCTQSDADCARYGAARFDIREVN